MFNVNYKISPERTVSELLLAIRLEKTLPRIVHENQCAYVKERPIFDAVRSINDVMEYNKLQNIPSIMTTFGFKKAFDSLSWNYLFNTLKGFNFGNSFLHWIRVLYTRNGSGVYCNPNKGFNIIGWEDRGKKSGKGVRIKTSSCDVL